MVLISAVQSLATAATENAPKGLGEVPSPGLLVLMDPQEEREQLLVTAVAWWHEDEASGRGTGDGQQVLPLCCKQLPFHLGDDGATETQMEMGTGHAGPYSTLATTLDGSHFYQPHLQKRKLRHEGVNDVIQLRGGRVDIPSQATWSGVRRNKCSCPPAPPLRR